MKISEQSIIAQCSQNRITQRQYQFPEQTLSLAFHPIKINDLLGYKQYILPFIFIINVQRTENNLAQINSHQPGASVKCEGTLAYENGCPVSLKQFRFSMLPYSTKLDRFFYINKKTYQIKFSYETSILFNTNNILAHNSQDELHKILHQKLEQKINNGKESLINFLTKIGLVSSKEKSINRYRTILMAQKAKDKMHKIIHLHRYQCAKEDQFLKIQPLNKKQQDCQNKVRSQITDCPDQIPNSQKKENRECCLKQQRCDKTYYPQVPFRNCPIDKVCEINIKGSSKQFCDEQVGGYFSVKSYNATIKVEEDDSDSEQDDAQMKQQKQTHTLITKIALKQLNSQYRNNQKYRSKIEHQMNIIKSIDKNNNKYVCSYYIPTQDCSNQVDRSDQFKVCSKDNIIMEGLILSLRQILSNQIYCNFFQVVKELLKAVQALHSNGIVHRDIKPANIMFNSQGHLKLIDFSESIECWKQFNENKQKNVDIGYTMPYSPLECMKACKDGYSNMKIDNYEVGMTILQIILGNLPVSYCKSLLGVIKSGWGTDQFHYCMSLRSNNLNNCLLLPLKILCLKLMERDAKKRICIESVFGYLLYMQQQFYYLK